MGQTIHTKGLVNSLGIQPNEFLLPLYEVVVNSIQSIEDRKDTENGLIEIEIIRSNQTVIPDQNGVSPKPPIVGFKVTDNGIGFIKERYNAFNKAFTDFNLHKGGKGVGRYTVLACFGSMEVDSTYFEEGSKKRRFFKFDVVNDIQPEENETAGVNGKIETKTSLNTYLPKFYKYIEENNISRQTIANGVIEHCLLYFINSKAPTILLKEKGEKDLVLNDYFKESIKLDKDRTTIPLNSNEVLHLDYIKRYDFKFHALNLCANNRLVGGRRSLSSSIPSLTNPIQDSNEKNYFLSIYATGNYLDNNVNTQRNRFSFSENAQDKSIYESFALDEIIEKVAENVRETYSDVIENASKERDQKVREFILNPKRPRLAYKHLLDVDGAFSDIASNASDEKMEAELHKKTYHLEKRRTKAFNRVFSKKKYDKEEFGKIVTELLKEEAAFSKGKLADMLVQRKSVIKLFKKYLEWRNEENYMLEEDLHNIIFTMGADSDKMPVNYHNLWLLDERLTFFNYISSDKQLRTNKHIESSSAKEPDLLVYDFPWAFGSTPKEPNSTVIFEFKRPGRDMNTNEDKNLDAQIIGYYQKLLESKAKDEKGNFLNIEDNSPKYGFVICELHKDLVDHNKKWNEFKLTPQGTLYKIKSELNLYIEVMSFQNLLDSVEMRHQAFFQSLGIDNL